MDECVIEWLDIGCNILKGFSAEIGNKKEEPKLFFFRLHVSVLMDTEILRLLSCLDLDQWLSR
jgi:hypothetical protein